MEHPTNRQIHEYHDDALRPALRDQLTEHLERCEACRAELEALRRLREHSSRISRRKRPVRDLWPEIQHRLDEQSGVAEESDETSNVVHLTLTHQKIALLALAAVLLVAVASGVTVVLTQGPGSQRIVGSSEAPSSGSHAILASLQPLERECSEAAGDLQTILRNPNSDLSPEIRLVVEQNLKIIDRAIRQSRRALQRDPTDSELTMQLLRRYEQKLDILRQTATATTAL